MARARQSWTIIVLSRPRNTALSLWTAIRVESPTRARGRFDFFLTLLTSPSRGDDEDEILTNRSAEHRTRPVGQCVLVRMM
jgi:hypothetical protein